MQQPDFIPLSITDGLLREEGAVRVYGFARAPLRLDGGLTHFGMVTQGRPALHLGGDSFTLRPGMFFVSTEALSIEGGQGIIIDLAGYLGLRQLGGPLEATGRLRYIDGCTDTLLVSPPRLGEPCLNHLHIPPNTDQSQHTHPSIRVGVIMSGVGECITSARSYSLQAGMAWWIPTGARHSFRTAQEPLDVIAWHPDSDFGPTDHNHPMLNKTIR